MASQHIEIAPATSRLSMDMRRLIDNFRQLQDLGVKCYDIVQQVASGGDWTSLGSKLGTTATDAETVYNLLVAVQDDLTSSDVNNFLDRLG